MQSGLKVKHPVTGAPVTVRGTLINVIADGRGQTDLLGTREAGTKLDVCPNCLCRGFTYPHLTPLTRHASSDTARRRVTRSKVCYCDIWTSAPITPSTAILRAACASLNDRDILEGAHRDGRIGGLEGRG